MARMWERALRRAGLPVASSQGFTPRPRISFGLALPTGAESIAEYVDIDLADDLTSEDVSRLPATLTSLLPDGFDVIVAAERPPTGGSLQEVVTSCTWELWAPMLDVRHHRERRAAYWTRRRSHSTGNARGSGAPTTCAR